MQNVLTRTDRLYTRYFKNACNNILNLSLGDVRKHDIGFLFRAKVYDKFFAQDQLMKVAEEKLSQETLEELAQGKSVVTEKCSQKGS